MKKTTCTLKSAGYLDMSRSPKVEDTAVFIEKAKAILTAPDVNRGKSAETMIASIYYQVFTPDYNKEQLELMLSEAESRYNLNPQVLMVVNGGVLQVLCSRFQVYKHHRECLRSSGGGSELV